MDNDDAWRIHMPRCAVASDLNPKTPLRGFEMSEYYEKDSSGSFGWFVAGLGLGALLGVLYAPKSGKETREELAASAREGKDYLQERAREVAQQASQVVDRGKEHLDEYVGLGKEYVERGRAQWSEYVDRGRDLVSEQTGKITAAVEAGREAYRQTTEGGGQQQQGSQSSNQHS
jgi:gas vesicle protein